MVSAPSLIRALASISILTGVSRIAGFARDSLTAALLGAGPVADAFFVALKLPNFFRRICAEGAFSVAFVPLYTEKLVGPGNAQEADAFAGRALVFMLLGVGGFTLLALAAMPLIVALIAPGFGADNGQYDLAVLLSRITFPYLLLMSLAALLGGALNARGRYAPFALAPALFNLTLIGALLIGHDGLTQGQEGISYALSIGVAVAGVLQLAFLAVCAWFAGMRIKVSWPRWDGDMRRLLILMGPGVFGAAVMQVNLLVDTIIASLLPSGSISHLYYADRLQQLPLGTIGIALATALLPMLSRAVTQGDALKTQSLFARSLTLCFALGLPAALGLLLLAPQIINALFGYGAFRQADVAACALVLQAYALGMPAYVATKVYASFCWARQDTLTPVKAAAVGATLNILLCFIFIFGFDYGVAAIALSTSLAGWIQLALLVLALSKESSVRADWVCLFKVFAASFVMAAGVFLAAPYLMPADDAGFLDKILPLFALVTLGGLVYATGLIATGLARSYTRAS